MKKVVFTAVAVIVMIFGVQTGASAQVERGNFIIDPYVGAPTGNIWWKAFDTYTDFEPVGPPIGFGGRFSYMVSDNFGIGLDVNYVKTGYEYSDICYGCGDYDTVSMTYPDVYETVGFEANKLRVMVRMDYHFVQTENVDVYLGAAAGYKYVKRQAYINGDIDADYTYSGALIPVATRLAIGMRYYFIPNFGLHLELGAGGGQIVEGGISVKF